MDDNRKGEIAYAFLKHRLKESDGGMSIGNNLRRQIGNIAKQTGVPFEEALEFATGMAMEILAEVSDPKKPATPDELEGHWGHGGH